MATTVDPQRKRMMPIYAGLPTEFGGGAPADEDADLFGPGEAGVLGGLTGTAQGDPMGRLAGLLKGVSAGAGAYAGGKALMPEDGEMDWGTVGGAAGGGAAGYIASSALLSLLRGDRPSGPGVLSKRGAEAAPANPALTSLLMAKQHSDAMRYSQKHAILRDLIRSDPASFAVDSDDGFAVGLTHAPTGFRIHMPGHMLPPELPRTPPAPAAGAAFDKAANKLLSLLYNTGSSGAKAIGTTAKSVGTGAVDGVKSIGRGVANTASAGGNYAKSLAGYGKGGPLEGQKLFNSKTVKPFMSPTQLKSQLASGANREALSATHQLPSWYHRIPGMTGATKAVNWADRTRVLHPLVQTSRTVGNVLSTPLTRPLTTPASNSLLTRGAANVARGGGRALVGRAQQAGGYALKGMDTALGAGTKVMNYGSAAAGTAGAAHAAWNAPANNAQMALDQVLLKDFNTVQPGGGFADNRRNFDYLRGGDVHNPEVDALRKNPIPAIIDGLTDKSDLAQMQRDIGRRHLPYTIGNSAHHAVQQSKTHPFYRTLHGLRQFSIGGNLTNAATAAVADPTPAPTSLIVDQEVQKALPKVVENYSANLDSPTGQRMLRLADPILKDPRTVDTLALEAAWARDKEMRLRTGTTWADPKFQAGVSTAKDVQPGLDTAAIAGSAPVRTAVPVAGGIESPRPAFDLGRQIYQQAAPAAGAAATAARAAR